MLQGLYLQYICKIVGHVYSKNNPLVCACVFMQDWCMILRC